MEKYSSSWWNSLSSLGKKTTGVILAIIVLFFTFSAYSMFVSWKEEKLKTPITVSPESASNPESVSDVLHLDLEQAKKVADFTQQSFENKKKPVDYASIPAKTPEELTKKLEQMAKDQDGTYFKPLEKKADRTLVVPFDQAAKEKTGLDAGLYQIWTAPKIQREIGVNINPGDIQKPKYINGSYAYRITPTDKKPKYIVGGVLIDFDKKGVNGDVRFRW